MLKKSTERLLEDLIKITGTSVEKGQIEHKKNEEKTVLKIRNKLMKYEDEIRALKSELNTKKRVIKEIRESLEELLSIQKLSQTIRSEKDPGKIFYTLVELSEKVLPIEMSEIFLLDKTSNVISSLGVQGRQGKLEEDIMKFLEEGIVDWVIDEKKIIVIPDFETLSNDAVTEYKKNYVFVPLIFTGEATGLFMIYTSKEEKTFTNQNLELLSLLTEQAAMAIENYRIKEQLKQLQKECNQSKEGQTVMNGAM